MQANMDDGVVPGTSGKYSSYLPEVYAGQDNRVERYGQYLNMDKDPAVNAALDTIAQHCTQTEEESPSLFAIEYFDTVTDAESEVLQAALKKWSLINKFKQRLFGIIRKTIMYGDQFYIRDPETFEMHWVNHEQVDKIIVDEAQGKKLDQYVVRDLDLNLRTLVATHPKKGRGSQGPTGWAGTPKAAGPVATPSGAGGYGSRFDIGQGEYIDANHVVQFSLSDGQDANWPFGSSVLESVFKPYKQKELIEDAVIIYRVQRAPERRVFYIDTGNAPPHKAMEFVNRISNEIYQRRIPTQTGGGTTIMDASYNPLSMIDDYFFPQTAEGRGSKVETLPGGDNLGEIDDMRYFNNRMLDGLRVPRSYISTGNEDQQGGYNDGKIGMAYMQDFNFGKYCNRIQDHLNPIFDREFKLFMKHRGIQIDAGMFQIELHTPQNFSKYRQIESDSAQISVFQPLADIPYLSKRFLMKRYLNLSEDEILENEEMWREENEDSANDAMGINTGGAPAGGVSGLSAVGIRPDEEMDNDIDTNDLESDEMEGAESAISGGEAGETEPEEEAEVEL